jgi:hypothetical protein
MFGSGEDLRVSAGSNLPILFQRAQRPSLDVCYLDRTIATNNDADDLTHLFLPPLGQDIRQAAANAAN